jgi:hypothetical protein
MPRLHLCHQNQRAVGNIRQMAVTRPIGRNSQFAGERRPTNCLAWNSANTVTLNLCREYFLRCV